MAPNPAVWQVVPGLSDAAAWYERQIAAAPEAAREAVAGASALALRARLDTELSQVLLLCDPPAELYAMLGIAALDGVPAPETAAGAVGSQVAAARVSVRSSRTRTPVRFCPL